MDLASNNLRGKIDALMDRFYGAGVASHPTIIEQINYLLFMRALSVKDEEYTELGITDSDKIVFDGELAKYKWENLLSLNAESLFRAIQECFDEIPKSTTNATVRLVFRNAHLKLYDKPTLRIVVHELDKFAHDLDESNQSGHRDIYGDMYEYLLSKLSQAGTSGQFRTPRHIIEFIVAVVAPKKGETILDPAVGTAGFLVKAFEYLQRQYTSEDFAATGGTFDKLSSKEQSFLYEHTFSGFDSDEDMIKFGMMNLYLHGLENALLLRQNSLTDTAGNRDKYDVIVANPPFSGKIDRDSVAQELQMNTGATEVLFLRYMLEHLTDQGRAGVIVPEGVLFNASGAHTKIRQLLLENGLWCVVSLPAGVFNPYAGVKTSIVFFDKTRVNKKEVLFAKVEHDGFSIGAQRRPSSKNDLPEILADIKRYQAGEELPQPNAHVVKHTRIAESKDSNLSGDRYKIIATTQNQKWPMVKLGDIATLVRGPFGGSLKKEIFKKSGYKVYEQTDAIRGDLESTRYFIDEEKFNEMKRFQVHANDLIMSCSGTLGRISLIDNKAPGGIINQALLKITPFDIVLPLFLKRLLESSLMQSMFLLNSQGGVIQNVVSVKQLAQLEIPLPPIAVQNEIVIELDGYQKIIDGARQVVENYKPTIKIDPNWPIVKLGEVVDLIGGGTPTKSNNEHYMGDIRWATVRDMKNYRIKDTELHINKEAVRESSTNIIPAHNVIIATRVGLGKVSWIEHDTAINQDLKAVIPKKEAALSKKFLVCVLRSLAPKIISSGTGATVKGVTVDFIKSLDLPLPSLEAQDRIVTDIENEETCVEVTCELIKIYEQKIKDKIAEVWGI